MKCREQCIIIGFFLLVLLLPSSGAADVSVPWESRDYHAHADAFYDNALISPYYGSDSDDTYSPPLPLPISASANASLPGEHPEWSTGDSTVSASDMTVATYSYDRPEGVTGGSASGDFNGRFYANNPIFQFSYSYECTMSAAVYPIPDYYVNTEARAWLTIVDLTDSVTLYDGTLYDGADCGYIDPDIGSSAVTIPVIIGHEIEVSFGISGNSEAHGCIAEGGVDFSMQYDTAMLTSGTAPVPWSSEDYHVNGYAGYWGTSGSASDSCDAYSPPLQLPINCTASVSLSPVCPGPPWASGMCQNADGNGAITNSEMMIDTYVYDILGDPWSSNYISDVSASASDDFTGSFTATHDLFEFSYSYIYDMGADCCGLSPPEYYVYSDTGVSGWLTVTDLTDSVILLNSTFLDEGTGCEAIVSDSNSDVLTVPVTVGHDIKVDFGISGGGIASGNYSMNYTDLTLQYDTAVRCIDPPVINDRTSEYFASLKDGYDDPNTVDEDVIKLQAVVLTGNFDLARNISVAFESGYNCAYTAIIGKTTLMGNMTIIDGTVTLQDGILELI